MDSSSELSAGGQHGWGAGVAGLPTAHGGAAASTDPRLIVVAVSRPLIRHGLLRLLEMLGMAGRIRVSQNVAETNRLLQAEQAEILLADPAHASELHRLDPHSLSSVRTLVITTREHVGESTFPALGPLCGMLSENGSECSLRLLLEKLLECGLSGAGDVRCGGCVLQATLEKAHLPLSPRELQIFLRIGEGAGPMQIASELELSVKTVESYREKIKQKLELHGRDALLAASMRWRAGYFIDCTNMVEADSPSLDGGTSHRPENNCAGRGLP